MMLEQIGFTTNGNDIELEAWINKNNGVITYFYNAYWFGENIVYHQCNIKEFDYCKNVNVYSEDYPTYEEYLLNELIDDMVSEFAVIEKEVEEERCE